MIMGHGPVWRIGIDPERSMVFDASELSKGGSFVYVKVDTHSLAWTKLPIVATDLDLMCIQYLMLRGIIEKIEASQEASHVQNGTHHD